MTRKSYQARVREQRERDILATAATLMRETGYHQLKMDDIAETVGISKSTLYQHFRSKEEMVEQVLMQAFDRLQHHMSDTNGTPIQRLASVLRYLLEQTASEQGVIAHLNNQEMMLIFAHHKAFVPRVQGIYQQMHDWIVVGKEQGIIRKDVSNGMIVGSLFSLLNIMDAPYVLTHEVPDYTTIIDESIRLWVGSIQPQHALNQEKHTL